MLSVLYRDADLLLLEKPAGLSSQEDAAGGDSIPQRLREQGLAVKTVHRLDRPTGGVMVYALTDRAAAKLSQLVGQHDRFQKDYLAVVQGCPAEPQGELTDLLYHDVRRNKSYPVKRARKGVRQARLSYTVLATTQVDGIPFSLVRVRLHTGRTHQIRVQFSSRQMPLAGDSRYGGCRSCPLGLWSQRLSFPHPFTGKTVTGESLPDITAAPWCWFPTDCYV